jgi:glutathionylspermidine synthase
VSDSPRHDDPVAAWHDGLTESLAHESAAWLSERQLERGIAFGDRPLCTVLRPRLLTPEQYRFLRIVCHDLLDAFRIAGDAALADRAFRSQFRLADWEETLLESSPRLDVTSPLSRLDAFVDPSDGIPRITEYNGETPAGTAYCDALSELFLAMPAMRPFAKEWIVRPLPARHTLLNTLLETWHRFRGVRTLPTIAIVDWHDVPTVSEFVLCQEYFQSMGCECIITTPDALTYDHGRLHDASGVAIDLIYKRVLIHELIEECGLEHPMVRAVVDGAVCMVNPFSCKPLHKKASLAVLSDERNERLFGSSLHEVIDRHVPWTRVVEERKTTWCGAAIDLVPWIGDHKDNLVLKPNDDYGGAGIVLGWEVDNATWEIAVTRAITEPYIVQQRIALPSEPFAAIIDGKLTLDDRIVDTAPFCWDGSWADGMLCRISTSTLVNVTAGGGSTVPTFVVEKR